MKSFKAFAATLATGAGITAALLGAGTASADSFAGPNFGTPNLTAQSAPVHKGYPGVHGPGHPFGAHGHLAKAHQPKPVHDSINWRVHGHGPSHSGRS